VKSLSGGLSLGLNRLLLLLGDGGWQERSARPATRPAQQGFLDLLIYGPGYLILRVDRPASKAFEVPR
jgi:hypothetical protein